MKFNNESTHRNLHADEETGMVFNKRYRLVEKCDEGGMGQIYKVLDLKATELRGHKVYKAIKVLPKEASTDKRYIKDLQLEAENSAGLNHPHIINVLGFDVHQDNANDWHYIVMEYLEGYSLDKLLIKNRNGISFEQLKPYLKPIANALDYAHQEHKLIHRDIKPSNIFFTKKNKIIILDFGVSYAYRNTEDMYQALQGNKKIVNTGGSKYYKPPEAAANYIPVPQTDIYSLAVTIYELLTGKLPYTENLQVPNKPIPLQPTSLNNAQWQVLLRALEYDPKNRPNTVGEFVADLCSPLGSVAKEQEKQKQEKEKQQQLEKERQELNAQLQQAAELKCQREIVEAKFKQQHEIEETKRQTEIEKQRKIARKNFVIMKKKLETGQLYGYFGIIIIFVFSLFLFFDLKDPANKDTSVWIILLVSFVISSMPVGFVLLVLSSFIPSIGSNVKLIDNTEATEYQENVYIKDSGKCVIKTYLSPPNDNDYLPIKKYKTFFRSKQVYVNFLEVGKLTFEAGKWKINS